VNSLPGLGSALRYLRLQRVPIPADLAANLKALGVKDAGEYPSIRQTYHNNVYFAVFGYLADATSARITSFKSEMNQAMIEALPQTADTAWLDADADLPLSDDAEELLTSFQAGELANIGQLFVTLKAWKAEGGQDAHAEATARADGYAAGLDALYNQIKVLAAGNQMLIFDGEDGAESCPTCQDLKGQRHRASWWIAHDLIPYRGNPNLKCGGWRCEHYLVDKDGNQFTQ
jgi:hypothetical protein